MAWQSWVNRISNLPQVLAGPILRHVSADEASVWVALRSPFTITLRVLARDSETEFLRGTARSIQIAPSLHLAVVRAVTAPPTLGLSPGNVYRYNLYFSPVPVTEVPKGAQNLESPGILQGDTGIGPSSVGYAPFTLPSFSLPPVELERVRLIHGSCRKAHANGRDAMSVLSGLIEESAGDANGRPHQLFLTGDQIYADDVAASLLFMLGDAGRALGFATESIPGGTLPRASQRAEHVRNAGITTDEGFAGSHLVTFAEFCTMYLFAWSGVLWQPDFPFYTEATGIEVEGLSGIDKAKQYSKVNEDVRRFRNTVEQVRRALANVPTYMIFDDHEVTDDWFLDNEWVNNSVKSPLLRRIVQNGLATYALFQGWGNTPSRFESGSGATLLTSLQNWAQTPNDANGGALRNGLGLPTGEFTSNRYPRHPDAVDWHYLVRGPNYQVLVMDCRTRRGYPGGKPHNHPELLAQPSFAEQFGLLQPLSGEQMLLVIAPAPPIGFTPVEQIQNLGSDAPWVYAQDLEFWQTEMAAFERLLSRVTAAGAASGGVRRARVALLSGDVHYGFAARLRYRATAPLEGSAETREAVIAQLTSSALKNEEFKTHALHSGGFNALVVLRPPETMNRYGWNNSSRQQLTLGEQLYIPPEGFPVTLKVRRDTSPIFFEGDELFTLSNNPAPDWKYQVKFIKSDDDRKQVASPPPKNVPTPPPGDKGAITRAHVDSQNNHNTYRTQYSSGKEIVGKNNLGELQFVWGTGENKAIIQRLWWWLESRPTPFAMSRFRCSLDTTDAF